MHRYMYMYMYALYLDPCLYLFQYQICQKYQFKDTKSFSGSYATVWSILFAKFNRFRSGLDKMGPRVQNIDPLRKLTPSQPQASCAHMLHSFFNTFHYMALCFSRHLTQDRQKHERTEHRTKSTNVIWLAGSAKFDQLDRSIGFSCRLTRINSNS
jgi:hypothetical protein